MQEKSAREMSEAFTAAFNAHDLSKAATLYRPDVVFVSPDAGEIRGREQVLEYFRIFLQAFPDTRIEIVAKHEAGETIIDEWIYHGTHTGPLTLPSGDTIPPTGKRVAVRGVDIGTFTESGVSRHRMYFDQVELLTQLGLNGAG